MTDISPTYVKQLENQVEKLEQKLVDAENAIEFSDAYNVTHIKDIENSISDSCDDHETYDLFCELVSCILHINLYKLKIEGKYITFECKFDSKKNIMVRIKLLSEQVFGWKYWVFPCNRLEKKLHISLFKNDVHYRDDRVFEELLVNRFESVYRKKKELDENNWKTGVYH